MDIFWVFILIFGVIVSIGQKASKQQAPTDVESEPTLSPEEEMERRIRELLEGKQTPPKATPPVQPAAKPVTPQKSFTPAPAATPQRAAVPQRVATPTRPSATPARVTKNATKASTRTNKTTDPIKQGEIKQSEIGRIIDDFTIEKATIYAEIMNPKYKEY